MPLDDSHGARRVHGYLASRRARRLNLRPPGRVAGLRMTDNIFNG